MYEEWFNILLNNKSLHNTVKKELINEFLNISDKKLFLKSFDILIDKFIDDYINKSLNDNKQLDIFKLYDIIRLYIQIILIRVVPLTNQFLDYNFDKFFLLFSKKIMKYDNIINILVDFLLEKREYKFLDYYYFLYYYNHDFFNIIINKLIVDNNDFYNVVNIKNILDQFNTNNIFIYELCYLDTKKFDDIKNSRLIIDNPFIEPSKIIKNKIIKNYLYTFISQLNKFKINNIDYIISNYICSNYLDELIINLFNKQNKNNDNIYINQLIDIYYINNKFLVDETIINYINNKINDILKNIDSYKKLDDLLNFNSLIVNFYNIYDYDIKIINKLKQTYNKYNNIIKYINIYIDININKKIKSNYIDSLVFIINYLDKDIFFKSYQRLLQKRIQKKFNYELELYYIKSLQKNEYHYDYISKLLLIINDINIGFKFNNNFYLVNNNWIFERKYIDNYKIEKHLPNNIKNIINDIIIEYKNNNKHKELIFNYILSKITINIETDKLYNIEMSFIQYLIIKLNNPETEINIVDYKLFAEWSFSNNSSKCAICRNELNETSIEQQLDNDYLNIINLIGSCGHVYHEDCIIQWLCDHNKCPLCSHEWNIYNIINY